MDLTPLIPKLRLLYSSDDLSDAFIKETLQRALSLIVNAYGLDSLADKYTYAVIDLAIYYMSQLDQTGLTAYSEGDLSWVYDKSIPPHVHKGLKRLNQGVIRNL